MVVLFLIAACSKDSGLAPVDKDLEFLAETTGNNLSFPVVWSSATQKLTLRGSFGDEYEKWDGATALVGTTVVWLQKDPLNEWQASTFEPTDEAHPDWVDWGDNLESKPWPNKSIVRTEVSFRATDDILDTLIYTHLPGNKVTTRKYVMLHVSGQGTDEVWGATQDFTDADTAMVYTNKGRLVIQRLAETFEEVEQFENDPENLYGYQWDLASGKWLLAETPKVQAPYTAEINVQGKIVFGYNWNMKKATYLPGIYRITFYTLPGSNFTLRHAQPLVSMEAEESEGGDGGRVTVDGVLNITYIDVKIIAASGSGGGGGGGGGNGGGGNGGGGGPGGPH